MKMYVQDFNINTNRIVNNKQQKYKQNTNIISLPNNSLIKSSNQVSFKGGLSKLFYKNDFIIDNHQKYLKYFTDNFGDTAKRLYSDLKNNPRLNNRIFNANDGLHFKQKSVFRSIVDSVIFPIARLPVLLTSFVINVGQKIPFLKKTFNKFAEWPFLKRQLENIKIEDDINILKGLLRKTHSTIEDYAKKVDKDNYKTVANKILNSRAKHPEINDKLFATANKFLDPKTGNYNTVYERPLNRIVSGLIPAFFLANDAYNLSVLCGDKKNVSDKEGKIRFHQEVSRVMANAYLQLISLGALTEFVNKSAGNSALITSFTVLFSEIFSRTSNGRPVTFISSDRAKEINAKDTQKNKMQDEKKVAKDDKAQNIHNKVNFSSSETKSQNLLDSSLVSFSNTVSSSEAMDKASNSTKKDEKKNTIFSFNSLMKVVASFAGAGLLLSFLRNSSLINNKIPVKKSMNDLWKYLKGNFYDKFIEKDFEIAVDDFKQITKNYRDLGYGKLAAKYEEIIGKYSDNAPIKLPIENVAKGEKAKFVKTSTAYKPFIDIVIQPFKFVWGAVSLPYKLIKLLSGSINSALSNTIFKNAGESSIFKKYLKLYSQFFYAKPEKKVTNTQVLGNSLAKVLKKTKAYNSGKLSESDYRKFIDNSIVQSFNDTTQSTYSNTDLGMLTKIVSSAITSVFLISDNYNMVMLKSNGEDKEGARQKAQERVVQRVSALFYQTMFMNWFNSVFRDVYNSSLAGMSSVVTGNTLATEFFTRASIGMPLMPKTYDQLQAVDEKNRTRKGFAGKYFRFMMKLTGKKPLSPKKPQVSDKDNGLNSNLKTTNLLKMYT